MADIYLFFAIRVCHKGNLNDFLPVSCLMWRHFPLLRTVICCRCQLAGNVCPTSNYGPCYDIKHHVTVPVAF